MMLTKIAEKFIGEDSGAPFLERITELEKDRKVLQSALSNLDEDYKLVAAGSKKLYLERDELKVRCDSLQVELASARSDAEKCISDLEAKVVSAEAHSAEVAIESKRSLKDFQDILVQQPERVHDMYTEKIHSLDGLCLTVSAEKPSVEDYLNWLSEEVSGLPDVFSGVNENFATAAIEGALVLAGDSIDPEVVRNAAFEAGADILPATSGVRQAAQAISKKWWWSFGYDYVLSAIRARQAEVLFHLFIYFWSYQFCVCLLIVGIDLF
jgi:hypothetical protein